MRHRGKIATADLGNSAHTLPDTYLVDKHALRLKWIPDSEDELRTAFGGGLLEERNWCELKAKLGEPTRGNNTEAAKDMASLAVDGGTIIYGIDEDAPGGDPLQPIEVMGLPERIGQIASLRIDPPLVVECTTVYHDEEAGTGYMLVHVPASSLAPHQVDGRYYGRDDKSKRALSDPEVERLFRLRDRWYEDVTGLLAELVSNDPFAEGQKYPHLFLAAKPVTPRSDLALGMVGREDWQAQIINLQSTVTRDPKVREIISAWASQQGVDPFLLGLHSQYKTADGARLSTAPGAVGRPQKVPEEFMDDLEIHENGEIRFFSSHMGGNGETLHGAPFPTLYLEAVAVVVREFLAVILEVSQRGSFAGMWDLGIAVTGIADARVAPWIRNMSAPFSFATGYTRNEYSRAARASAAELEHKPGAVAERLLGYLVRGMNASGSRIRIAFIDAAS